ncbi:MAG: hypothetical protein KOO62_09655 [candidate division Zixibacteria bacterium]|nr:hypothetical protein [candidate division Zixibacteria bacterium]
MRNWTDLDWYADLTADAAFAGGTAIVGTPVDFTATIHNSADFDLNTIPVNIYNGAELIVQDTINVNALDSTIINVQFTPLDTGTYTFTVIVDEDNIKIESDDSNNNDSAILTVVGCCVPPTRGNVDYELPDEINIADLTYLVAYLFTGGSEPPCVEESDIDGNGEINIADLTYLVSYLFTGGPAPVACP